MLKAEEKVKTGYAITANGFKLLTFPTKRARVGRNLIFKAAGTTLECDNDGKLGARHSDTRGLCQLSVMHLFEFARVDNDFGSPYVPPAEDANCRPWSTWSIPGGP